MTPSRRVHNIYLTHFVHINDIFLYKKYARLREIKVQEREFVSQKFSRLACETARNESRKTYSRPKH